MQALLTNIRVHVNSNLYIADPTTSVLGQKILSQSVILIDEIGLEKFTFRKLAEVIESTEASIYRYFKNKNQLLCYLIAWYWGWMEYLLAFETANLEKSKLKLEKAVSIVTATSKLPVAVMDIDLSRLHRIVQSESSKSFLTKDVDRINKEGAYVNYKQFVERVAEIILEYNPSYLYPNMLVSTIIEGAHLQYFFAEHLPRLTNKQKDNPEYLKDFFLNLLLKTINK
jgi:AcrR family transcriptional regulator